MVVAIQTEGDNHHMELISPTSEAEVLELKDLIEGSNEHHIAINSEDRPLTVELFVCVSKRDGTIKYSNFGLNSSNESRILNIIEVLDIKCPIINRFISGNNRDNLPEINSIDTILHGHVCFVTLNETKMPVIIKLQQVMENERLLIWLFKKASIEEVTENGFIIDDEFSKQYQFTKLKFILAVDSARRLLNAPNDLLKKIMGENYYCKPRHLEELIEVSDELKQLLNSSENKHFYEKFSTSSLDMALEKNSNILPIFCTETRFKCKSEMIVSVNLFNSIYNSQCEPIFPLQVKYQYDIKSEDISLKTEKFPEFPGIKIIRKISESIHSTVYEAIHIFQSDSQIIIKLIHVHDHMDVPAEIKFYEYFTKDPVGCEFIEKPLKIELTSKPAIFMKSGGNRIDLFEFIQSNSHLSDENIKTIFHQVVKAVDYLHSRGIVHRDIKVRIDSNSDYLKYSCF